PVIGGQPENYLLKQLHDFERGDRHDEVCRGWQEPSRRRNWDRSGGFRETDMAGAVRRRGIAALFTVGNGTGSYTRYYWNGIIKENDVMDERPCAALFQLEFDEFDERRTGV